MNYKSNKINENEGILYNEHIEYGYYDKISFDYLINDTQTISAILFKLDTGRIEIWAKNNDFIYNGITTTDYMTFIDYMKDYISEKYRQKFYDTFHIDNLQKLYMEGITEHAMDYERKSDKDTVGHFCSMQKFIKNYDTDQVMCLYTVKDITKEKNMRKLLKNIVKSDYDFVAIINTETNNIEISELNDSSYDLPLSDTRYDERVNIFFRKFIVQEEIDDAVEKMSIKSIVKELNKNNSYECNYSVINRETKKRERKLWKFLYFNEEKTKIIYTRRDITDIYEQERLNSESLATALIAANQASIAKTDFLSRMSHEIRTPMNAIIGMATIAAQSIGNDEKIEECISKIGISARFLLSLINDILNMSRIESGKMLISNDKIAMDEFINSINSICYSQANAKNIDYECIIDPMLDDYYIGDGMKLQQVLVNILSNAIKFTNEKGKVIFNISLKEKEEKESLLHFVISDTGIGISEEFLSTIFEPFEQENKINMVYGGTGLGLAISKSIIDLMNGKITVHSIQGVGTEFSIDVKLGITEESLKKQRKTSNYMFKDLKTLVVDDDVIVCESAIITLKEMGISAEWVDSGIKAVERVHKMWINKEFFDMILIDWKMPEMDGIETASRIRKIVGEEVTIIIITAYDWTEIEHEAKKVGVNILISKPIFKSSLVSAFSKVMGQKEEKKENYDITNDYDFTGKRILLVEDHPLNVEVAVNLLEKKGFKIDIAENGLRSIELFNEKGKGYYDVILMDIRMPVMDGLQASKNIRQMSNPDAKSIPIIAMTANAFDDDIDKSKAAGMNAHLTKPIDPHELYQTLYNFVFEREEK